MAARAGANERTKEQCYEYEESINSSVFCTFLTGPHEWLPVHIPLCSTAAIAGFQKLYNLLAEIPLMAHLTLDEQQVRRTVRQNDEAV